MFNIIHSLFLAQAHRVTDEMSAPVTANVPVSARERRGQEAPPPQQRKRRAILGVKCEVSPLPSFCLEMFQWHYQFTVTILMFFINHFL